MTNSPRISYPQPAARAGHTGQTRRGGLPGLMLRAPWAVVTILNLPVDRQEWQRARQPSHAHTEVPTARHTDDGQADGGQADGGQAHASADGRNPYLAAAAQLRTHGHPGGDDRPDSMSWQHAPQPLQRRRWYTVVRALLVIVIVLLSYLGLRAIFRPATTQTVAPEALPAGLQYPAAAAAGVAERFTTAYLTWNEATPDSRGTALLAAGWGGDPKIGWNSKGRQAVVGQVTSVAVTATTDTLGSITTVAQIDVWGRTKAGFAAEPTRRTVALRVQIAATPAGGAGAAGSGTGGSGSGGGTETPQLGVAAAPALVSTPTPPALAAAGVPDPDPDLSAATRPGAETFFAAYAKETDLSAITAPGAQLAGLGGAVSYARITLWQVNTPADPDQTAAVAVVVWAGPDGSEAAQTYNLTLRKVASGATSRWQVYAIT